MNPPQLAESNTNVACAGGLCRRWARWGRESSGEIFNRPNGVGAREKEGREAERKYRVAEAGAEVLPKRSFCTGIVRREKHCQHENQAAEASGTHQDTENECKPDCQFAVGHEEGDAGGVREDKASENGRHEGVSATLEEFVDPELKAAVKSEGRTEDFVLAENQEKNAHTDAKQGESMTIASAGI